MEDADKPAGGAGQFPGSTADELPASADLVILGAGIMGLWAAVKAARRGTRTVLVEQADPGFGASGGLLGALMPHMPDKWNDKKQFQFDALVDLEAEVAAVEAEAGLPCFYRRSGRLIPLPKPHLHTIALRHEEDAAVNWHSRDGRRFHWHVLDRPAMPGWPDGSACASGLVHDTLAARVSPRHLVAALAAVAASSPQVTMVQAQAVRIDAGAGRVICADGRSIGFGQCIVAAGHRSFALLDALSAEMPSRPAALQSENPSGQPLTEPEGETPEQPAFRPLGQAVKGQTALLAADIDPALPVIFLNGLYVVAHEQGRVAIGSTSEDHFDEPFSTDAQLDALIAKARALVPLLADAPVVERWAGLRPKAIDRDPMVGPHPAHPNVIALTGGFKVSFGLAHRLADAALDLAAGGKTILPAVFLLEHHLNVALR